MGSRSEWHTSPTAGRPIGAYIPAEECPCTRNMAEGNTHRRDHQITSPATHILKHQHQHTCTCCAQFAPLKPGPGRRQGGVPQTAAHRLPQTTVSHRPSAGQPWALTGSGAGGQRPPPQPPRHGRALSTADRRTQGPPALRTA